ncbi:MAG: hypothetical protein HUU20_27540 [Pirellulales bacterium]|nr:hypothetical protein [Pirellulales bacterium]
MDELEILQSIDEARAALVDDSHPPWEAPDESMRMIRALPHTDWRMLRRVLLAFQS